MSLCLSVEEILIFAVLATLGFQGSIRCAEAGGRLLDSEWEGRTTLIALGGPVSLTIIAEGKVRRKGEKKKMCLQTNM